MPNGPHRVPNPRDRSADLRRRAVLRGGAAIVGTGLAGCVITTETVDETTSISFDPAGAETVEVRTPSGDVTLATGDGSPITGTARKTTRSGMDALDEMRIETSSADGTVHVGTDWPRRVRGSVDFDLSIPPALAVATARTSNGTVRGTDLAGNGTYRSTNGDIDLERIEGFVTCQTANGSITARDVEGLDGARTVNGDVDVDIPSIRTDVTCRTTNGAVTVALPDDLPVRVSLRTVNGRARIEGPDVAVTDSSQRSLEGRLGTPEYSLSLRSTNGDVTLTGLE